ncbi:MAG: DUF3131 domain-containing protein [Paracoccaceae bacterium]
MLTTRRGLLGLFGIGVLGVPLNIRQAFAQSGTPGCSVLLTGVTAATPVSTLRAILAPFIARGVPVALVVKMGGGAETPAPGGAQADFLQRLAREHPRTVEFIPELPDLADMKLYFQMRRASMVRQRMDLLLGLSSGGAPISATPVSIATVAPDIPRDLTGVRIAGYRNVVLLPEETGDAILSAYPGPVLYGSGGIRHVIGTPLAGFDSAMDSAIALDEHVRMILALDGADVADTRAEAEATTVAAALAALWTRGRILPGLPREILLRWTSDTVRLIAIRLDAPQGADAGPVAAFADALRNEGIAFTLATPAAQSDSDSDPAACVLLPLDDSETADLPHRCVVLNSGPPANDALDALATRGARLVMTSDIGGVTGLDGHGLQRLSPRLEITEDDVQDDALASLGTFQDALVTITPGSVATRARRSALLNVLRAAKEQRETRLTSAPGLMAATSADDPVFAVMRKTRESAAAIRPDPTPLSDAERAALLKDARIAWSFVSRLTDARTGLCPSTAFFGSDGLVQFRKLTMWDLGSLIFAILSARKLGLIDEAAFHKQAASIVKNLPIARIGGLSLPRSEIDIDAPETGQSDFNACDTGRLLSALYALSRAAPDLPVAQAVARWDLDKTIVDGMLSSITNGRRVPFYISHCTSYCARAYALWGLTAKSPYSSMKGDTPTDARMALLYEVADIGAIGAEPLLLQEVELGPTPATSYLSDVLFAAQFRAWKDTGKPYCVSESPMDRSPWFSYQGFLVNSPTDPWSIEVLSSSPEYKTEEFRKSAFTFSTKSAFLWAARHRHEYSRFLLQYAREKARDSAYGYAAGVYVESGEAMANYTDINTNGIILAAIAHALDP